MSRWIGPLIGLGLLAAVVVFWSPTICTPIQDLTKTTLPFCGPNYHLGLPEISNIFNHNILGHPDQARLQQEHHNIAHALARHRTIPVSIHSATKNRAFDKAHPGGPHVDARHIDLSQFEVSDAAAKANLVEETYERMSI